MIKKAETKPHQERVAKRLLNKDTKGLIAYHSLGSGKTYTALNAINEVVKNNNKAKTLFIVPASLKDNVNKEIDKHKLNKLKKHIDIMSYEKATKDIDTLLNKKYDLVVFDEAHRLRNNTSQRSKELGKLIAKADKNLLLTGTAGYNQPADIMSLINIINPKEKVPLTPTDFNREYIDGIKWGIKNNKKKELSNLLNKYVDKYDAPQDIRDFPKVNRKVIEVEMSPRQTDLYRAVEKNIPAHLKNQLRENASMSVQDAARLNVFSQGVRQASNALNHYDISATYKDSPKIMAAVDSMYDHYKKTPGFRGVMYSNYLDSGIDPYVNALRDRDIDPLVFTGKLSQAEKKKLVDEYNKKDKKSKVLILSSSGAEGLDLKRTNLMQILEPHFNKSKVKQAEGRAIRYKSHDDLPEKDRVVNVEEYRSTLPKNWYQKLFNLNSHTAIDNYLASLSDQKQKIIRELDDLMRSDI